MIQDTLFDSLESSLRRERFRVERLSLLPDPTDTGIVGSRTRFSWKGLVIISEHFVARNFDDCSVSDMKAYFNLAFKVAKKRNRVPLFRGLQFGYMVYPCAIVSHASPELIAYACSPPTKHWCIFEFPVVHDLSTGQTHYFRGTCAWGAFFFSDMRRMAGSLLETPATQSCT